MFLNWPTVCTATLVAVGSLFAAPVLYQGFTRRGKGVFYEKNFLIQRAPQYATLLNVIVIVLAFLTGNSIIHLGDFDSWLNSFNWFGPMVSQSVSWLGVVVLVSGLVFMIGGWYSLGESFTTDAEVLDGHKIRKDGLLKYVMHPAYSGIIQSVLGASLASSSLLAALICVCVVAPLWLNRAKYEEALLLKTLGAEYKNYAEEMGWRRLVPRFIPIGV
ncbi:MAG: hypothetical protein K2W82_00305 [Candidatus Obscuribacterales bacterium]|nr:hypothetical protein [Candidatus Obscuribacterales bacterium]